MISPPPDPRDLPLQQDAAALAHTSAHLFAEVLDLRRARRAAVDQEVGMQRAHLGIPDPQAPAAGLVDEAPGAGAGRVLEGRAAGAGVDRLRRPA